MAGNFGGLIVWHMIHIPLEVVPVDKFYGMSAKQAWQS